MRRDLSPQRMEFRREQLRVTGELVEVMDVHDDVEAVLERLADQKIGFGVNIVGQSEIGSGAGVMMPGDGQTDMIKAFGLDMNEICLGIFHTPVLSRRY